MTRRIAQTLEPTPESPPDAAAGPQPRRRIGDRLLHGYTWLVIVWLMRADRRHDRVQLQQPARAATTPTWVGFTTKYWYEQAVRVHRTCTTALRNSLLIAVVTHDRLRRSLGT